MAFYSDIFHQIDHYFDLTTIIINVAVLILVYTIYKLRQFKKLPPGPWGIPIFGYLPFLSKEPYKDFAQIAKKYGDLFSLKVGSRFVVILNSHEKIKTVLKNPVTDGKPQEGIETDYFDNSVLVSEGTLWKKQRNFLLSAMKDLGFGKSRMEELVQHEVLHVMDSLTSSKREPFDITITTKKISSSVMAHFTFKHGSSTVNELVEHNLDGLCNASDELNFMAAYNAFPHLLEYLPATFTGMKFLMDLKEKMYSYLDKIIDYHEETYDTNDMRNLIDIYIKYKSKAAINKNDELCNRRLFKANVLTFFQAGVSTTESMLGWIFRILSAYPDVQKAIQAELDEVVGRDRLPSLNDIQNLPYTQAVLLEMDRYVSLVPLTLYHRATEKITFEDYEIPKNTCIMANLWNVHNAQDLWTEPEKFNPSRFLDVNGKIIVNKTKNVIPFSIGNRNCLGEPLAKMEIFLVVTMFLQKFFFTLPKGEIWKFQPEIFISVTRCHRNLVCAIPRS